MIDFSSALAPSISLPGLFIHVNAAVISTGTATNTSIGQHEVALAANSNNWVEFVGGTVSSNTSGFTIGGIPICTAQTNINSVVTLTDARPDYITGGGGGGTPGGADTQIQFNDAGSFGGNAAMVFDKTAQTIFFGPTALTSSFEVNPTDGTSECDFSLTGGGAANLTVDNGAQVSHLQMTSQHANLSNNDPAGQVELQASNQVVILGAKLGFFSTSTGVTKPVVTGVKADPVAASILAALTALGLVTDSTT